MSNDGQKNIEDADSRPPLLTATIADLERYHEISQSHRRAEKRVMAEKPVMTAQQKYVNLLNKQASTKPKGLW